MTSEPSPVDATALKAAIGELPSAPLVQGYDIALNASGSVIRLAAGASRGPVVIGCLQDMLTGVVVHQLAEEGRLNPYTYIGEYLPELDRHADGPGARVRIIDLLSHASGFAPPGEAAQNWSELVTHLNGEAPMFPAGTVVNHDTQEQAILINLVQRVTGVSLYDQMNERLFALTGLALRLGDSPMGGLSRRAIIATMPELVAIAETILDPGGAWGADYRAAVERDQVKAIFGSHLAITRAPVAYSWGLARFANGLWGQNGSSEQGSCSLRFDFWGDPVIACDVDGSQVWRERIIETICSGIGRPPPDTSRHLIGAVTQLSAKNIAGRYRSGAGLSAEVFVDGPHMHCMMFRQDRLMGSVKAYIEDDGLIFGSSRIAEGRVEFFPHPQTGAPALHLALKAYVAA